jgi:glycosyltransferase involved in cell wall biosynthesis
MRVAVFTDNDFDKINGVTTTLRALLRYSSGNVQPRIYTASDVACASPFYYAVRAPGVGLPLYRDMRIHWPRVRAFARELRQTPVDVVHTTTPGPVGLAARWLAARLRVPLVGSYHTEFGAYGAALSGSDVFGHTVDHCVRWYYGACDPLFVPSTAIRHALAERGYRADRLRLWGRGVDSEQFSPTRASSALRTAWEVGARRPAILYAGRLSREKGLALVGPVRRHLLRHGVPHRFVFAGDGPMRSELESLCPDGCFLGALPHDEVAVVMASADFLFFPSGTDTLGNVVLEAQASGLPVVVSDRGGPREHVTTGRTGFVCADNDPSGFAEAVTILATRTERRVAMGRAAREYAVTRDWPHALAPLVEAWTAAARRRASASRPLRFGGAGSPALHEETTR